MSNRSVNSPKLSLCMIVRDNELTIRESLDSIKPWVDEMIIIDTGSKDATPDICRELGARVEYFEWRDDFSAARNESLEFARGDWILWMDSDDRIDARNGRALRKAINAEHAENVLAYWVRVRCPSDDGAVLVDQPRLLRNGRGLQFEGRIHEQITPSIASLCGKLDRSCVTIEHALADRTAAGRLRKRERDQKLLELELKRRPQDPLLLVQLGMTYYEADDMDRAIETLKTCLEASASVPVRAYIILVSALMKVGNSKEANRILQKGLRYQPGHPELLFGSATLDIQQGRFRDAERALHRVLVTPDQVWRDGVDEGILGYKARHNLALVYAKRDALARAITLWRQVVEERPTFREAVLGLVECYFRLGRLDDVDGLAVRLCRDKTLRCLGLALRARVAASRERCQWAKGILRCLVHDGRSEVEAWRTLAAIHLHEQAWERAEWALKHWCELAGNDPRPHHELGILRLQLGRSTDAVLAFQQAVEAAPAATPSWVGLGDALWTEGRYAEAKQAWHTVIAINPACEAADFVRRRLAQTASIRTTMSVRENGYAATAVAPRHGRTSE